MTTGSSRRRLFSAFAALALVAALVSCGGSGDSSSDTRQRNSALEECLPGDPNETTTTVENDPCTETTTTVYEDSSRTVTCDVTWEPTADGGLLTACPETTYLEIDYPAANGNQSRASNQGNPNNIMRILQYSEGTATVKVYILGADGTTQVAVGTVEFQTNVTATKSFTYEAEEQPDPNREVEVSCTISWNPNTSTLTSCPNVHIWWELADTNGLSQRNGSNTSESFSIDPEGLNSIYIRAYAVKAVDYDGSSGFGGNPTRVVELLLAEKGSQTFTYKALASSLTTTTTSPVDTTPVDTTPVDTTPVDTTPVDTTPAETSANPREAIAATVSVQELPCAARYTATSRSVTLCESFDRVIVATFGEDGKYTDTIEATGSTVGIPEALLLDGGARFLRIAVAEKMSGRDVATFRGEGILEIGDPRADSEGTLYVSPAGQEAINNGGNSDYFEVALRSDAKFDIYEIEDNELAFVTLNGEMYPEYDRVSPPSSWDEGKPLAWRAYQTDGFGLPRLVASGTLALGSSTEVEYVNPSFELNSQRVEILSGEMASGGNGPSAPDGMTEDPCGPVDPYMITTPVTPSGKNLVTLTVATDCASTESMLGLVVYDYDNDWVPIFSQFKSTRYSTRIVATTYLADGEYDVMWGDYNLVGVHEYVVNGGGSGAECFHPRMDVDVAAMKATLSDCDRGAHRMRVYAEPIFMTEEQEDIRLPFKDNVIDLSMVTWDGFFEINLRIDDSFEPDFITCLRGCESAITQDEGLDVTLDASTFSSDAGMNVSVSCAAPGAPSGDGWESVWRWGYTDLYRAAGRGSYVYEGWVPFDPGSDAAPVRRHFAEPGDVIAATWCGEAWGNEATYEWAETAIKGLSLAETGTSMPNRPSNDRFEDAPAIEPNVGRVEFTNVSSTNEQGEMGIEYSTSADAGQFHSVWFTYTPTEDRRATFRIVDYTFDALVRVTTRDEAGRTVLVDETEVWAVDRFFCGCDSEWPETVSFAARQGVTYYIQVTNEDYETAVGNAALVVNGGEGDTVRVAAGDTPFANPRDLRSQSPTPTVPPVTTTSTTVAPTDTSASPADTTPSPTTSSVPQETQNYRNALEQGSQNETVTVLAPVGDSPAVVEAREDARTVQIPVSDLFGTVSAASANVDTARSLVLRQPGARPIRVRPTDRTVSVPVGTDTTNLSIVATTTDGKKVAAPLTIKKTVKPMVAVTDGGGSDGGSGLPVLPIGIAVILLLAGAAGFGYRRRAGNTNN